MAFKQRRIKPGTEYTEASAIYVVADGSDIPADSLVVASGVEGAFLKVKLADNTAEATAQGMLWVAKHIIPEDGRGVALPWKLIDYDTDGMSVGDAVYLDEDGGLTDSLPNAEGGAEWARQVGTVASVGTSGKVLLSPNVWPGVEAA